MTPPTTPNDSLIRLGITVNAALSLIVGALFVVGASAVGEALGVEIDGWIRLFGVVLIGHALILAWVRQVENPAPWTWLNLAMIAPYPLLMVALAVTVIEPSGGKSLALLDGALVGTAALLQYLGLRRINRPAPIRRATA